MKHTKKRVAALLLALAMVLSLMPMAFAADEYPEDMPAEDDASYAAVKSAYDNGIMTGENGKMNLEGTILRSTVSKMVVTAFAAKGEADLSGYPDVDSEAWYAAWMAKANQMGIMTGSSGKMNPGNEVTLAEVAAMLVRALGLSVDKDAAIEGVDTWAAPYIKALLDAGYISSEDVVGAHQPMSRVAFAEVIYQISGKGNYAKEENAEITKDVDGNIVITANGVSLKGITVTGDVIIADGVDASTVTLDNVKVEGRVVVRGAGVKLANGATAESTVVAATAGETSVTTDAASNAGDVTVVGTNGKAADKVTVDAPASNVAVSSTANEVEIGDAKQVVTADGVKTTITGTVDDVVVPDGAKPEITNNGTIKNVTSNEDVAIAGTGTVENKTGSGTVTDGSGNEVAGSDEPADIIVPDLGGNNNSPTISVPEKAPAEIAPVEAGEDGEVQTKAEGDATKHTEGEACTMVKDEAKSVAPTCTADGKEVKVCSKCGKTTEQVLGKLGHADESDGDTQYAKAAKHVEANCRGAGYASYSCTRCGTKNVKVVEIPATAHEAAATPKYVTKTVEGTQKHFKVCKTCNTVMEDTAEACAPADDAVWTDLGASGHSTTCKKCGGTIKGAHNEEGTIAAVAATCTTAGNEAGTKCTVCEHENPGATIAALGHQWGDWVVTKDDEAKTATATRTCGRDAGTCMSGTPDGEGNPTSGKATETKNVRYEPDEGGGDGDTPCENERNHASLHTGQKCPNCDVVGTAPHDSDKCPGQACSCGVAGAKGTGSHDYKNGGEDTAGTCIKCNSAQCPGPHQDGQTCSCGWKNDEA